MRNKIGIMLENRFIDKEIAFYKEWFPEKGYEVHFLTRLWGQKELTFKGMEENTPVTVNESFEELNANVLKDFAAIIMPAGYVADFLLYAEKPKEKSPAVKFLEEITKDKDIIKGYICHALWIAGPSGETMKGRKVTCHNNIISHVENTGMIYVDSDVYADGDIVTARTGGDYEAFAKCIIKQIEEVGKE